MRPRRRALSAAPFVALCLGATACTGSGAGNSLPSAAAAAASFASAFNAGDGQRILAAADREARKAWSARRLTTWLARQKKLGHITSMRVQTSAGVPQPQSSASPRRGRHITTSAPYTITYRSAAARRPVRLQGELPLTYSAAKERWQAEFRRTFLWPGVRGASTWHVSKRWPRRAPVLDRRGRVLAAGSGAGRRYPQGALAGSTVGHLGDASRKELKDLPSFYERGDFFGASGLEATFNDRLAGSPSFFLS